MAEFNQHPIAAACDRVAYKLLRDFNTGTRLDVSCNIFDIVDVLRELSKEIKEAQNGNNSRPEINGQLQDLSGDQATS